MTGKHLYREVCLDSRENTKCYQELILQYKNQNETNFILEITLKDR